MLSKWGVPCFLRFPEMQRSSGFEVSEPDWRCSKEMVQAMEEANAYLNYRQFYRANHQSGPGAHFEVGSNGRQPH